VIKGPWRVPTGWTWATFEEVARVASDLVDPHDYLGSPHIAPNHIESGSGLLLPYKSVREDGVTSAKHRFRSGQILYSKIRPYLAKVVRVDFDGLCSADMYPIESDLDHRFLKWWMLTREFTRRAAGEQARTVLPKINKRSLATLPVPVPPMEEQLKIVEMLEDHLSRLDAADRGLAVVDRRLRALESSTLAHSYGDNLVPVGDVSSIQGGIQKQPKRTPTESSYPFLRVANVTSLGLALDDMHRIRLFDGELDRLRLQAGDLLVVEGNGSPTQIGRAALWDGSIPDCVHQNHLIRVRPNPGLLPGYLEAIWNSPQSRRQLTDLASSSSGLHTLSVSKLKAHRIPVPPMKRQSELVNDVSGMRASRSRMADSIRTVTARSKQLRQALLEAAFSGRLTGSARDEEVIEELSEA